MKYAVARMQGSQPRMFAGRYDDRSAIWPMTPVTTGRPDAAKQYDDIVVAQTMAAVFNVLDRVYGANSAPWVAMPLPETPAS